MQCSKQCDYVMTLAGHPATDGPHRRPKAHKAPGGGRPMARRFKMMKDILTCLCFRIISSKRLSRPGPTKKKGPR